MAILRVDEVPATTGAPTLGVAIERARRPSAPGTDSKGGPLGMNELKAR
jgi:hypothetical protein